MPDFPFPSQHIRLDQLKELMVSLLRSIHRVC